MDGSGYRPDLSAQQPMTEVKPNINLHVPSGYGDNRIVLMVRDPWTLYTYWEVNKSVEDKVRGEIARRGLNPQKSILRVYDVTDSVQPSVGVFDFELRNWVNTWYVHTPDSGRKWMVDIGIICDNGEFFCLARSNMVETPSHRMSDICDERWMCTEDLYYKLFAVAGGYGVGTSSLEMKEILERHLKAWISSGGISSGMFGSASLFFHRK